MRDAKTLQWQYLTPVFEAIYGLSREEARKGDDFRDWLDLVVPEDRECALNAIERVRAGEHVTFDYRIRRPRDGSIRWLRNTDFPLADADGKVTLIAGVGHDLTELRETERRLQVLMEAIPQLVWRAVGIGDWTWSGPQWTEHTGLTPEESAGKGWLDALHPADRGAALRAWNKAAQKGRLDVEVRICRAATHEYHWFQTRALPVLDEFGTILNGWAPRLISMTYEICRSASRCSSLNSSIARAT
jgi:PAS domain S-box-containing protein